MFAAHLSWIVALFLPQYFSPYVSVDLHRMASAFNTSVSALEDELTHLILDGQISARIDSHAKVVKGRGEGREGRGGGRRRGGEEGGEGGRGRRGGGEGGRGAKKESARF